MKVLLKKLLALAAMVSMVCVMSCSDDPEQPVTLSANGYFIVNEGGYPNDNSSLSFFDRGSDQVINDVFFLANNRKLGIQAQSMTVYDGKGYIVVQASGKVEVIDVVHCNSIATITEGLESPRYVLIVSPTKAYVSDWGLDGLTGTVKVLNLTTNTITASIPTGKGANQMVLMGGNVYVANSGGYDKDNTISVIDPSIDEVEATIEVGDNPNSIVEDAAGNLWVTSSGAIAYNEDWSIDEANSTKGSISKIVDDEEAFRLEVDEVTYSGPSALCISPGGNTLYYKYNGGLYSMITSATQLPADPFVSSSYYGLSIDPITGNVLGLEAPNYSSAGNMIMMDTEGDELNTYVVGISPNGVAFK